METIDQTSSEQPFSSPGLTVTRDLEFNWLGASKWARFLAILGFVSFGLSAFSFLALTLTMGVMGSAATDGAMGYGFAGLFSIIMLLLGVTLVLSFFINLFHLRFANGIGRALALNDQVSFERSWLNLRNLLRLLGILTIIAIAFYIGILMYMGQFMNLFMQGLQNQ